MTLRIRYIWNNLKWVASYPLGLIRFFLLSISTIYYYCYPQPFELRFFSMNFTIDSFLWGYDLITESRCVKNRVILTDSNIMYYELHNNRLQLVHNNGQYIMRDVVWFIFTEIVWRENLKKQQQKLKKKWPSKVVFFWRRA